MTEWLWLIYYGNQPYHTRKENNSLSGYDLLFNKYLVNSSSESSNICTVTILTACHVLPVNWIILDKDFILPEKN